jgi:glycerol uptake facilitator protein
MRWISALGPEATWREGAWSDYLSEFLGTFVLVLLGCGVNAMAVAALAQSGHGHGVTDPGGVWVLVSLGWGFAVAFGVYVAGGVSGAHINPAVTVAFALRRKFPWRKVPGYCAAQLAGAFVGAAVVYGVYQGAILAFEVHHGIVRGTVPSVATFGIFGTHPATYLHTWSGPFVDQVVGTALLLIIIAAVVDNLNQPVRGNLGPLVIGIGVTAIALSFGVNAGFPINPARDLGPRLLAWLEGWRAVAVPGNYGNINGYMWIPIIGPLLGGILGLAIYDWIIHTALRARGVPEAPVEQEGRVVREELD